MRKFGKIGYGRFMTGVSGGNIMKKWGYIIWIIAIIVLGLVFLGGCAGEEEKITGTVSADSYEMDLQLDTEQKVLMGTVEMAFTNRTDGNLESVVVRNYPASILKELKKGSAEISAVTAEDGTPLSFSEGKDPSVVTVKLGGEGLSPDESTVVRVSYKTDIPKVRERFGVYTEGKDEYYLLTFCFPSLSVFEDGKWNDSPYIFGAESTYSKVCDYKVRFEAPKDFGSGKRGRDNKGRRNGNRREKYAGYVYHRIESYGSADGYRLRNQNQQLYLQPSGLQLDGYLQ